MVVLFSFMSSEWNKNTTKIYPSAPLEKDHLEQRLEKILNDVNRFNKHINNVNEMITYFKDKTYISKKK